MRNKTLLLALIAFHVGFACGCFVTDHNAVSPLDAVGLVCEVIAFISSADL